MFIRLQSGSQKHQHDVSFIYWSVGVLILRRDLSSLAQGLALQVPLACAGCLGVVEIPTSVSGIQQSFMVGILIGQPRRKGRELLA